jgi:Lar family restriction alleviation protein
MKLKPCPFCGGDARLRTTDLAEGFGLFVMSAAFVQCADCGARTLEYRDETFAIEDWNRRAGERDAD